MRRATVIRAWLFVILCLVVCLAASPAALAAAPGTSGAANTASSTSQASKKHYAIQDPKWLATKMGYGIRAHGRKLPTTMLPAACTVDCPPSSVELSPYNVELTMEPGDGQHLNDPNGSALDAALNPYLDSNMFNLCGPGAADNALFYWPAPPNALGNHLYTDRSNGVQSTWGSSRYRSYMMRLAWDIQPPGWTPGMMDSAHNPSYGVTLYDMRDGLNWEASGENTSTWSNYFYAIRWWGDSGVTQSTLHSDVVADTWNGGGNGVGVVAEVDAHKLSNWGTASFVTKHFITIIGYADGYNNGLGPQYYYTDTCGNVTGCGSNSNAGIQIISQSAMWTAITNVPVNKSTAYNAGDGGWVW